MYTKIIYRLLLTFLLTISSVSAISQIKDNPRSFTNKIEAPKTTKDTINKTTTIDSIIVPVKDSILPKKKNQLDANVTRKAKGYDALNQKKKEVTLYDKAELYYNDIELKAGIIILNYEKNEVYAGRIKDSTGQYTQRPYFKQGSNVIEPDSIRFNFKTKKALIWNSRTEQAGLNIKSEVAKRENDSVYYMRNARLTTSKNIDDPEYYILVRKIKFVPKQKVVLGLSNLVIADVPTPLGIPFGYFPMTEKSTSGFIMPTPGQSNAQGYFLQNGGYYFALSENYDLAVLGDYYTNGSYGLRAESSYAKRYKFRGNVNFRFENNIQSEKGFPDYVKSRQYNIQWSHSQDSKASPNSRFNASVNLGSSQYFRNSVNINNIGAGLNNTLNSSISYNTTLPTLPKINIAVTANHSQNTNTGQVNMTLPTLTANVDRIYPFASENESKKGFIKNINLQYNLSGINRITTQDSLFLKSEMFDDAIVGMQHRIPINTNFKIFNYLNVGIGANFNETWTLNTVNKQYSASKNEVITTNLNGFDSFRTYDFNANLGTTIYGTFNFKKGKKIKAIRHIIAPSIGYSYTPNFDKYFDTYALDATGNTMREYSRFEGGVFSGPSNNMAQMLTIGVTNNFEAKVKDKDSKEDTYKKIKLLNALNFNTSYNINADSLAWSPMRISTGTQLFKQKMTVNLAATVDPYAIDNAGKRLNTFNINNGGSLFRMTSANLTMNYAFSSKDFDGSKPKEDNKNDKTSRQTQQNGGRTDDLFGRATDLSNNNQSLFEDEEKDTQQTAKDWYNTKLPWDLNMAYSMTYGNMNRQSEITSHSIMFSGNLELAPRWKVGISSGYDMKQQGFTFTQFRFERDLESWRMSFNWVPEGNNAFWGFFIGIKSSVLSDIKWDKRQLPDRRFN